MEFEVVEMAARPLVAVQARIGFEDIPGAMFPMMDKVWAYIQDAGIEGHGHNVWVYHQTPDGALDVEIGVELAAEVDGEGDVVCVRTPGGPAAHTFHYGEYEEMPKVHQALMAWCERAGHRLGPVSWEVYGDWHEDPARRRTDVYRLLAAEAQDSSPR